MFVKLTPLSFSPSLSGSFASLSFLWDLFICEKLARRKETKSSKNVERKSDKNVNSKNCRLNLKTFDSSWFALILTKLIQISFICLFVVQSLIIRKKKSFISQERESSQNLKVSAPLFYRGNHSGLFVEQIFHGICSKWMKVIKNWYNNDVMNSNSNKQIMKCNFYKGFLISLLLDCKSFLVASQPKFSFY